MKRFVLTPRAKRDVNDIWDYIAADNVEAADRVLDALDNAMVKLAKTPGIGPLAGGADRQTASLLSGLFVFDRVQARNKTLADYPGSPRSPRCAEHSWPDARRALADYAIPTG